MCDRQDNIYKSFKLKENLVLSEDIRDKNFR